MSLKHKLIFSGTVPFVSELFMTCKIMDPGIMRGFSLSLPDSFDLTEIQKSKNNWLNVYK